MFALSVAFIISYTHFSANCWKGEPWNLCVVVHVFSSLSLFKANDFVLRLLICLSKKAKNIIVIKINEYKINGAIYRQLNPNRYNLIKTVIIFVGFVFIFEEVLEFICLSNPSVEMIGSENPFTF